MTSQYIDFSPADTRRLVEASPLYSEVIGVELCATYASQQDILTAGCDNVRIVQQAALRFLQSGAYAPAPATWFIDPHRCRCEPMTIWDELFLIRARACSDEILIPQWSDCAAWNRITAYDISRYVRSPPPELDRRGDIFKFRSNSARKRWQSES